jgi:predicted GNAT family acetyltransferase
VLFRSLLKAGPSGEKSLRLPSPLRGAVWVADLPGAAMPAGAAIGGALLCHPSRLAYPVFPADAQDAFAESAREGDRRLALLSSSFSPATAIGLAKDVERYESALALKPRARVSYRLMARTGDAAQEASRPAPYPRLSVRRATIADLDALLPLQEAYEREEVLTPIHEFNGPACRASLARALERQLVYAAEEGGIVVGKAGTNARGFVVDQIGGVYTHPARRGRGVAAALMAALLAQIAAEGRRASLFVKPENAPALSLYRGLGFEEIGDYRADYFEG